MTPSIAQWVSLVLLCFSMPLAAQRHTPCHQREGSHSEVRITTADEPGERLVISGRVLAGAKGEPVASARVLAFHTDARGYYSEGGMDERNARLCGVLRTDDDGRYRIDTIRPAHYATGGPAAHVHFEVTLPDGKTARMTLNFEGDPKLGGAEAGEPWERIRPLLPQSDGSLRVERDLWVR